MLCVASTTKKANEKVKLPTNPPHVPPLQLGVSVILRLLIKIIQSGEDVLFGCFTADEHTFYASELKQLDGHP